MYPLGLPPDVNGNGTTPEGYQLVISSRYASPGVIGGLTLTPSPSEMRVEVGFGAACARISATSMVEIPVQTTQLALAAAPTSGARTDLIVLHGAGATPGLVAVASEVPAGAQELGRITVPAGATTAAQCQISGDRQWAMLAGAGQGLVAQWTENKPWGTQITNGTVQLCSLRIPPSPQPRRVEIYLQSCLFLPEGTARSSVVYDIQLDGVSFEADELVADMFWTPRHTHHFAELSPGVEHVITVSRSPEYGDRPKIFGGAFEDGSSWPRTLVRVTDIGTGRG